MRLYRDIYESKTKQRNSKDGVVGNRIAREKTLTAEQKIKGQHKRSNTYRHKRA